MYNIEVYRNAMMRLPCLHGESMINRGWGEPVAKSHLFRLGVADPIRLSGKAVMSATGRVRPVGPPAYGFQGLA